MKRWSVVVLLLVTVGLAGGMAHAHETVVARGAVAGVGLLGAVLLLVGIGGKARLQRENQSLRQRLREANERAVVSENSSAARAERALAESRAEADRLRAELERGRQELERAQASARQLAEQARAGSAAAADRQGTLERELRATRAEIERLGAEIARAREEASRPAQVPGAAPAASAPAAPVEPAPERAAPPAPRAAELAADHPLPPAVPVAPPPAAAAPIVPPAAAAPDAAAATLLLVDDDADFRAAAGDMLREAGYQVIEAGDGPSALEQAQRHAGPLHLVIMDLVMPGMNGRQTAQRLAAIRPGVSVLYISGYVDEAAAREAIAGEDADFLSKPFEADTFTAKVQERLPQRLGASA